MRASVQYAVATGRAERDPSADLKGALPPAKVKHHPSITEPKQNGEDLDSGSYGENPIIAAQRVTRVSLCFGN